MRWPPPISATAPLLQTFTNFLQINQVKAPTQPRLLDSAFCTNGALGQIFEHIIWLRYICYENNRQFPAHSSFQKLNLTFFSHLFLRIFLRSFSPVTLRYRATLFGSTVLKKYGQISSKFPTYFSKCNQKTKLTFAFESWCTLTNS